MSAHLTVTLIFAAVLTVVGYAIRRLSTTPARIVAVIFAIAAVVGALKPIVALVSDPQRPSADTVAPPMPPSASAPTSERLGVLPSMPAATPRGL